MTTASSSTSRRLWLALATVYVIWGSTYLAIRVAVETLPPFLMAGIRFVIAGAVLYAFAIRRGDVAGDRVGAPQWRAAAIVGGFLLLGGNGGVVWAEQRVPSGITALIIATVPIWMAVFSARRTRERPAVVTVAGLVLGFAGTALLVRAGQGGEPVDAVGAAVLVGASVSWAFGSVWAPHLPLPRRPLVATSLEMLTGGVLLTLAGIVSGELGRLDLGTFSTASLVAMGYLIVFGSFAGFTAYVWLLHNTTSAIASTYAYVNPVIAVFLGWLILEEAFAGMTVVAAVLIIGAVALIVRTATRREPPRPAEAPLVPEEARRD